jgi:predicted transposase/invertase (TIGR01784 family)
MKMMFCDVVEEEATRNYNNAVKTAETRGREEGEKVGLEKGLVEGEKKAKIESAKRFLSMGLSVEQVAVGTGLSLEEVEKLK